MKVELLLFIGAFFWISNIYTDGKLMKTAFSYKKYYQMIAIACGAIFIYWIFRKNPRHAHEIIASSNEYLKYLPIDHKTTSFLSPIIDFTSKYSGGNKGFESSNFGSYLGGSVGVDEDYRPILTMPNGGAGSRQHVAEERIRSSGLADPIKKTKRSVSETKKKFVAARQGWICEHCNKQLPAWFEVDHKIRLEYGGSNHIDNLVALCRDCHGAKTAMENL
jgi:hypothetical protein